MPQMIVDAPQLEQLKQKVKNLGEKLAAYGGTARMVILVVGGAPIVRAQAQTKVKLGAELGVAVEVQELPTHTSVNSLLKTVRRLNGDQDVDGIYLEPPLPHHLAIINPLDEIVPEKDVTGYHPFNLGRILAGDEPVEIYPLLPKACLNLLANEELRDSRVVIIGRHAQICRPLAPLMANRGATVTVCDETTKGLAELCRQAQIVITAVGRPDFIRPEMVRQDAVVVDAGYLLGETGDTAQGLSENVRSLITLPRFLEGFALIQLFANLVMAAEKRRD